MDGRVAESDGQNRIDNPYNETRICRLFFNEVIVKNYQPRRSLDYVLARVRRTRASQRTRR